MYIVLMLLGVALIPSIVIYLIGDTKSKFAHPGIQGFGVGVYIALVILLLRESTESMGIDRALLFALLGLVFSLIIGIVFKEFHHHHSEEEREHRHTKASMWRILISDIFHNIVDGIAIVSGFLISPFTGITSFTGVLGHQIIQQSGQQALLIHSGITQKKALLFSTIGSLSVLFGLLIPENETLEGVLMSISVGIILWKVLTDIRHFSWNKKSVLGLAIGVILLSLSLILIPHSH